MAQFTISNENTRMLTKLLSDDSNSDSNSNMHYELMQFWDDPETVRYLQNLGYTLYHRLYYEDDPDAATIPALPFAETSEGCYPYASYSSYQYSGQTTPLRANGLSDRVVYAQDSQLRHVAMKLVLADSEEYRILCFLHKHGLETLRANCILPILELLPFGGFWLAVMPRWGIHIRDPRNHTMREILHIMHSMLKGLAFLHSHNIIHRDMKMGNVLINHFQDDDAIFHLRNSRKEKRDSCFSHRTQLRKGGKLSYAVMDFNVSLMIPRDIRKEDYRRPYHDSFCGSGFHPFDTAQGEFDYNPFAFDVGTLGVVFCVHYQHYAQHIPMLAPLLDKMTTRDISRRFTAAEALQFFEDLRSDMTEAQLNVPEYPAQISYSYDRHNRWAGLPDDFQRRWAAYREPPIPIATKVLRSLCYHTNHKFPATFIRSVRLFCFTLALGQRSMRDRLTKFLRLVLAPRKC